MEDQLKRLENLTNRLENVAKQLSSKSSSSHQSTTSDDSTNNIDHLPVIQDYAAIINESIKPFVSLSQKIGGELTKMSEHVSNLFQAQQEFIGKAIQSKKPADNQLMNALKPQSSEIEAIMGILYLN